MYFTNTMNSKYVLSIRSYLQFTVKKDAVNKNSKLTQKETRFVLFADMAFDFLPLISFYNPP